MCLGEIQVPAVASTTIRARVPGGTGLVHVTTYFPRSSKGIVCSDSAINAGLLLGSCVSSGCDGNIRAKSDSRDSGGYDRLQQRRQQLDRYTDGKSSKAAAATAGAAIAATATAAISPSSGDGSLAPAAAIAR